MSPIFQRLTDVRHALLGLHKALLEAERVRYERENGNVSPGQFLQVVINDPAFDWLHRLSELVVQIDEQMEDTENLMTAESARALLAQAQRLVTPSETGQGFARHYFEAIQADPAIAMMQGQLRKLMATPVAS